MAAMRMHNSPPYPRLVDQHRAFTQQASLPSARIMPQSESDADKDRRKRIAVACARCRKRKIKCSGDQGNGSSPKGCSNCMNAGMASACTFLRVNSRPVDTNWSYGPSSTCLSTSIPSLHGLGGSSTCSQNNYTRASSTYGYPGSHVVGLNRPGYLHQTLNYGDDVSEGYHQSIPSYAMSSQESSTSSYTTPEHGRSWSAVPQSTRPSSSGLSYFDTESSNYATQCSGMSTSVSRGSLSDSISSLAGMSQLTGSLPPATDRLLPIPAGNRVQLSAHNSLQPSTNECLHAGSYLPGIGQDYRPESTWTSDSISGCSSNSVFGISGSQNTNARTTTSKDAPSQDSATSFGYHIVPSSRSPPHDITTSGSYSTSSYTAPSSHSPLDGRATTSDENIISTEESLSQNYNYTTGRRRTGIDHANYDNSFYSSFAASRMGVQLGTSELSRRSSIETRQYSHKPSLSDLAKCSRF